MAKGTTLLDKNKNIVYPRTILEQVYNKAGTARLDVLLSTMRENLEGDIADTNVVVARLRADLDALLADSTLSGEVLDAIVEIKTLLDSNSSDVVSELVATMSALRAEAIRNVAQELTLSQKQQARQNIDAAGVSATYGDGLATLSYGGNAIFPETKGNQVKLSIGGNAEDAIKANGGNIEKERVRAIAREDEIATELSETKEKVDVFLADADTSADAIDKLKELQEYIKNDETSASQMLGDIAQNKQDIADNTEALEKEATRAKQVEMYLESQKANKYGYYENLSVGVSDNLSGRGEATESEFSFRPSGGENKSIEDGTARINSIKGNSVVWNSEYKNGSVITKMDIDGGFLYRNALYISLSQNKGDKIYICQTLNNKVDLIANAGFLTRTFGYNTANRKEIPVGGVGNSFEVNPSFFTKGVHTFATIHTVGDYAIDTIYCDLQQEDGITDYSEYSVKLVNLTKMFNGINVPTTVEEFEALYGNMPNEYNAGTIIDNHTTAIKSVGVNILDVSGDVLSPPVVEYNDQSMPKDWAVVGKMYSGVNDGGTVSNVPVSKIKKIQDGFEITCESSAYGLGFFVKVLPNMLYDTSIGKYDNIRCIATFYDKNRLYLSKYYTEYGGNPYGGRFRTPSNCEFAFLVFTISGGGTGIMPYPVCHLSHDGYMTGKYNPYPYYEDFVRELPTIEGGLKGAGTAYDEIRYNKSKDKWEHVKRIGSVDLGTLDWSAYIFTNTFWSNEVVGCVVAEYASSPNFTSIFKNGSQSAINNGTENGISENLIGVHNARARIMFYSPSFEATDEGAALLKQSLQGVILNYELAEPIVTELDVDISPDYKVWDYGTEEAISEVLSTPVRVNTNYGFNAVGQITDNTELIKELLARVAVLEAQLSAIQATETNVEEVE